MRTINAFIIENELKPYTRIAKICAHCEIDFFPKTEEEFHRVRKSVLDYLELYYKLFLGIDIESNKQKIEEHKKQIVEFFPSNVDIILLDVTLVNERKAKEDNSGLIVKNNILDAMYPDAYTLYVTADAKESLAKKFSSLYLHEIDMPLKETAYVPKDLFMDVRPKDNNILVKILNRLKTQISR